MKRFYFKRAACSSLLLAVIALAACTNQSPPESATSDPGQNASSGSESGASPSQQSSGEQSVEDPLGKYDTPVIVNAARYIDPAARFGKDDTIDDNVWTQEYLNTLGIQLKSAWTVQGAADQYNQKLNLSIASGTLPDMFAAPTTQFQQLAQSGQLADLTDAYNRYASPLLKEVMDQDGPDGLGSAMVDGKLMGLPRTVPMEHSVTVLYIRADWLEKVKLDPPQTMDDVFKISEAFTNQDPDGNGKKDTYGMALDNSLNDALFMSGFYNAFNSYPDIWIKDADGNLVNGSILPETKTALGKLQEMYKAGEIDPEFGTKNMSKASEAIVSGQIGMMFGPDFGPSFPLLTAKNQDPNADWEAYPMPLTVDAAPVKFSAAFPVTNYYVVRKGFSNPEALIKMANLQLEKHYGESTDLDKYYQTPAPESVPVFKFSFTQLQKLTQVDTYKNIMKVTDGQMSEAELPPRDQVTYNQLQDYRETGDMNVWNVYALFKQDGVWSIVDQYLQAKDYLMQSAFYGAPTPTMIKNQDTLTKLQKDTFTKIIMGAASLDEFDKFVSDWKKLGGEQITQEVNDWYSANQN
ncbi:extracellular solute-binding protein [Paenibacillus sp. HB172176]|uniref:extracellular solute-binding protein n=1 Tax=Paenibacillus sp. HB172176 TaxID=2493690 RepID=UPI00143BD388|nr:extracellular solute-binding protein [Paenibacillus sp. HB172176]